MNWKFKLSLQSLIFWTGLSVITSLQVYIMIRMQDRSESYLHLLFLHFFNWLPWALITPFIVVLNQWISQKFSTMISRMFLHLIFALTFSVIYQFLSTMLNSVWEGVELFSQTFWAAFGFFIGSQFYVGLLIYGLIIATIFYLQYRFKFQLGEQRLADLNRSYAKQLSISSTGKTDYIAVGDIDYIEAADYYASIISRDKSHLMRKSLNELERELDPKQFLRIHRSVIVNRERISSLEAADQLKLDNGKEFKVSRNRIKKVKAILNN